jgi:hypothetical protein
VELLGRLESAGVDPSRYWEPNEVCCHDAWLAKPIATSSRAAQALR